MAELLRLQVDNSHKMPISREKDGSEPPGGDMLEARVKHLEEDMREVKSDLKALRSDMAEIKGHLRAMPTTIQLLGFVIAIFVAAGIVRVFG